MVYYVHKKMSKFLKEYCWLTAKKPKREETIHSRMTMHGNHHRILAAPRAIVGCTGWKASKAKGYAQLLPVDQQLEIKRNRSKCFLDTSFPVSFYFFPLFIFIFRCFQVHTLKFAIQSLILFMTILEYLISYLYRP